MALEMGRLEVLQTPRQWAIKLRTQEELNDIFIAKGGYKILPGT
jgi:hypothetical protein